MAKNKGKNKKVDLSCFSENAKNHLNRYVNKYKEDLINQALLIEERNREESVNQKPEITATHVARAEQTLKVKNNRKKTKLGNFLSFCSEGLIFITGLVFDIEKMFSDQKYFCFALVLFLFTLGVVLMKHMKGDV